MSQLTELIQTVPNWQNLTAVQLFNALEEKIVLELYKTSKTDQYQDRTQNYKVRMTAWDGNPATEPEF